MAIETAVLQNINQAYETFKKPFKDFNPTKTNREAITQHIAQSGLAHARWTVDIFRRTPLRLSALKVCWSASRPMKISGSKKNTGCIGKPTIPPV